MKYASNRGSHQWTSRTQRERKERMSLFRKKPEPTASAFDQIPMEVQGQILENLISVCRTARDTLLLIPTELRDPCAKEFGEIARRAMSKLMRGLVSGDVDDIVTAFEGFQVPPLFAQAFVAVKLALEPKEPNGPSRSETNP